MKHLNLLQFLDSDVTNTWISEPLIRVYVRKGNRVIDKKVVKTLDIANITVAELRRGQGIFTAFLTRAERIATERNIYIYIENVFEDHFGGFFIKRGYVKDPRCREIATSLYLCPKVSKEVVSK